VVFVGFFVLFFL